jgi:ribonuclease HI
LILLSGTVFEQSVRLEYFCTNNQAEYEAILLGL